MADVTVNIRGDASQLKLRGGIDEPSPRPISIPPSDRLIEEVRAEIQSQRFTSTKEAIEAIRNQESIKIEEDISARYNARRADMQKRMASDYENIDKNEEERRKSGLENLGDRAKDPIYRSVLEQQLQQQTELEYKKVGQKYDVEEEEINTKEKEEKTKAEIELTSAIKELAEYFRNKTEQGEASPDSYIGRLRAQQKSLITERDTAQTEAGAIDAGNRLVDVNDQLRRVLSGGNKVQGKPYYDSMLQGSQGLMNMFSGMQSGDIGSTIMGGGSAIAGLSGMGLSTALKFLGWVGAAAGAAKMLTGTATSYESLAGLSAFRSTTGYQGEKASQYLGAVLPNSVFNGKNISDYGYDTDEFGAEAAKRIKARGTADDWFAETLRQVGLERDLALNQGALQEGSKYDRYGINVTDAITRLVGILDQIKGSGVSMGDFTRVQEKYDIQQQLMGSYMNRTDKPNYDVANQMLAAFSSVKGITQDTRVGTDIQSFQNMIQNPMNERMRALIYSTVADLFPETGGRMDLIDRALQNPSNEGKIMQAVVKRVTAQFGDTNTTMGYFAAKALVGGISPDRRDAYWKAFNEGGITSDLLKNPIQGNVNKWATNNKDILATQSTEFITAWTKGKDQVISKMNEILGKMTTTSTMPTPNRTKSGGTK
jgi:hypothetical protein